MPSIIPSYVYSLFAALIVGTIVVCACSLSMVNVKSEAANQELQNINEYVAAQSLTLLSHTTQNTQNSSLNLQIPTDIGNQRFFVHLGSDPSGAWVESGFCSNITVSQQRVYLSTVVEASGTYVSDSGRALLLCQIEDGIATLTLTTV